MKCGDSKIIMEQLPVAVIGAGPVGLAAAARLLERGLKPLVLEAGPSVGTHLLDYGHVRLFSPWRYDIDSAMAAQLQASGWQAPDPEGLPLAKDVVDQVLLPFARLPAVAALIHLGTKVLSISREGFDKVKTQGRDQAPFVIRAVRAGEPVTYRVSAVLDASGTWSQPNPLGANGLPALGEPELSNAIFYGIPEVMGRDRARYAGKKTLVVGGGHSAANALLELAELARNEPGTRLVWALRSTDTTRVFGGGSADGLPARGELGLRLQALLETGQLQLVRGMRIERLHEEGGSLKVEGLGADGQALTVAGIDEVVCATGQRPNLSLTSELRLRLDPWLESTEALGPLIDPNLHSCGTVRPHGRKELRHPELGFYTLGVKSYGRAPTFLMATGFEQARSVVAALAGDLEAADRVELDLPETGVCSSSFGGVTQAGPLSCCGPSDAIGQPGTKLAQSAPNEAPSPACGGVEKAASTQVANRCC